MPPMTTKALSDVIVEARPVSGAGSAATDAATHADTTGATGTYTLRVPYGSYNVTATKNGYDLGSWYLQRQRSQRWQADRQHQGDGAARPTRISAICT